MLNDLESMMDDMLAVIKIALPVELALISTDKGDNLLNAWSVDSKAYYLDAVADIPNFKSSVLLFEATDPTVSSNGMDSIETRNMAILVFLFDDAKNNVFRMKKRFDKAMKNVITKHFIQKYKNHVKYNRQRGGVTTSSQGVMYQVSATYFTFTQIT